MKCKKLNNPRVFAMLESGSATQRLMSKFSVVHIVHALRIKFCVSKMDQLETRLHFARDKRCTLSPGAQAVSFVTSPLVVQL